MKHTTLFRVAIWVVPLAQAQILPGVGRPGLPENFPCSTETNALLEQQDIHQELKDLEKKFKAVNILEGCDVSDAADNAESFDSLVNANHQCALDWSNFNHELKEKCEADGTGSYTESHHAIQCIDMEDGVSYRIEMTHVPNCLSKECEQGDVERVTALEVERIAMDLSRENRMHCRSDFRIHDPDTFDQQMVNEQMDLMHEELEEELKEQEEELKAQIEASIPYGEGEPTHQDNLGNDLSNGSIQELEEHGSPAMKNMGAVDGSASGATATTHQSWSGSSAIMVGAAAVLLMTGIHAF
jgi:hypothetical protein